MPDPSTRSRLPDQPPSPGRRWATVAPSRLRDRSALADATLLSGGPYPAADALRTPGVVHGMRDGRTWCGLAGMQLRLIGREWDPEADGHCLDCVAALARTGVPVLAPAKARAHRDSLLARWRGRMRP